MFERKLTEAQLQANRENAKKSTGPKTEEGKRTSSLNGYRHGHTGQVLIETDEDHEARVKFVKAYVAELAPEGVIETDLAHAIAATAWRRNRIHAAENNYLTLRLALDGKSIVTGHAQLHTAFIQAETVFARTRELANLALYEQRLTNLFQKNLKALEDLRKQRAAQPHPAPPAPKAKAAASTASSTSPENGFAFSNEQTELLPDPVIAPAIAPAPPQNVS
ncbi:MAG: hypothetical protein KGN84_18435 [Acidobacteriota bacterium]|nr:hypothetical protein [Acidobacteriota bacterium]